MRYNGFKLQWPLCAYSKRDKISILCDASQPSSQRNLSTCETLTLARHNASSDESLDEINLRKFHMPCSQAVERCNGSSWPEECSHWFSRIANILTKYLRWRIRCAILAWLHVCKALNYCFGKTGDLWPNFRVFPMNVGQTMSVCVCESLNPMASDSFAGESSNSQHLHCCSNSLSVRNYHQRKYTQKKTNDTRECTHFHWLSLKLTFAEKKGLSNISHCCWDCRWFFSLEFKCHLFELEERRANKLLTSLPHLLSDRYKWLEWKRTQPHATLCAHANGIVDFLKPTAHYIFWTDFLSHFYDSTLLITNDCDGRNARLTRLCLNPVMWCSDPLPKTFDVLSQSKSYSNSSG